MIYLTADLHGDLDRLQQVRKPLRRHDSLIVLGDFGFIWNGSKAEQKLLRRLGKGKGTLLFLDGAHENFDLLAEYPVVEFAGGQARKLGDRPAGGRGLPQGAPALGAAEKEALSPQRAEITRGTVSRIPSLLFQLPR